MKSFKQSRGIDVFFLLIMFFGLFALPTSLFAQSEPVYMRDTGGVLKLLPNRGYRTSGTQPVAQNGSVNTSGSTSAQPRLSATAGLSVSCSSNYSKATIGQPVAWFSTITGGPGSVIYKWSGTNGLVGNTSAVAKVYTTNGKQTASLTVTSGNQAITIPCGFVQIGPKVTSTQTAITQKTGAGDTGIQPQDTSADNSGASCSVAVKRALIGDEITWLANISNATASTTYAWDGTDNLSGDRPIVSKTYSTTGVKYGTLTITTRNERMVVPCANTVTVEKNTKSLLAASLFAWITAPLFLIIGLILAILIGVFIAKKKKRQEEKEEEERDHVE